MYPADFSFRVHGNLSGVLQVRDDGGKSLVRDRLWQALPQGSLSVIPAMIADKQFDHPSPEHPDQFIFFLPGTGCNSCQDIIQGSRGNLIMQGNRDRMVTVRQCAPEMDVAPALSYDYVTKPGKEFYQVLSLNNRQPGQPYRPRSRKSTGS